MLTEDVVHKRNLVSGRIILRLPPSWEKAVHFSRRDQQQTALGQNEARPVCRLGQQLSKARVRWLYELE